MLRVHNYKSKADSSAITKVLYKKRIQSIMRKKDTGAKYQLIANVIELLRLVRINSKHPELRNLRIVDGLVAECWCDEWREMKMTDLLSDIFTMLLNQCLRARASLSELSSLDSKQLEQRMYLDDPLRMVKHLDSFVNRDQGYNWGGERLLDRDEMSEHIIQTLTCRLPAGSPKNRGDEIP